MSDNEMNEIERFKYLCRICLTERWWLREIFMKHMMQVSQLDKK